MGMTMTQKILAAHAGLDTVVAGQLIEADLDLVLGNDITSPVAIHEIEKLKQNNNELREIVNNSWDGIGIIDKQSKFIYVNTAFVRLNFHLKCFSTFL